MEINTAGSQRTRLSRLPTDLDLITKSWCLIWFLRAKKKMKTSADVFVPSTRDSFHDMLHDELVFTSPNSTAVVKTLSDHTRTAVNSTGSSPPPRPHLPSRGARWIKVTLSKAESGKERDWVLPTALSTQIELHLNPYLALCVLLAF